MNRRIYKEMIPEWVSGAYHFQKQFTPIPVDEVLDFHLWLKELSTTKIIWLLERR